MQNYRLLVAVASIALSSCATPVDRQLETLASKAVCCKSFSELDFETLSVGKPRESHLDDTSKVMQFQRGKAYVVAFQLPKAQNRALRMELGLKDNMLGKFFYLEPELSFLDSNRNILLVSQPVLQFVNMSIIPYVVAHMQTETSVPDNADFVVVHSARQVTGPTAAPVPGAPMVVMSGKTPIAIPSGPAQLQLVPSPTGVATVTVLQR